MNTKTKILAYSFVGLAAGMLGYTISNEIIKRIKGKKGTLDLSKILVCSHIGSIEGGSRAQNNLGNIQKLLENDIDIIEMDVQITKDGVPVLFHDDDMARLTNGTGDIRSYTFAQLSQLRYKADNTQGIPKLEDAIKLLKKSRKPTIFQLDKCYPDEIKAINALGLFKGLEKQMLSKGTSFTPSSSVIAAGIEYMPIIPTKYVGNMNTESVIDEIVNQCKGFRFLEAQFGESDTLLLNGTLSNKLSKIGCKLLIVAVGGGPTTNAPSYRGDNKQTWAKMINPTGAGVIMTDKPLTLREFIKSVKK